MCCVCCVCMHCVCVEVWGCRGCVLCVHALCVCVSVCGDTCACVLCGYVHVQVYMRMRVCIYYNGSRERMWHKLLYSSSSQMNNYHTSHLTRLTHSYTGIVFLLQALLKRRQRCKKRWDVSS